MALCAYGFLTPNMTGGLCFGAGLGITLFGIMYMFVHDGLVHRSVLAHQCVPGLVLALLVVGGNGG